MNALQEHLQTLAEVAHEITEANGYELLRVENVFSCLRYATTGCGMGDFLTAMMSNDLMETIGRADKHNAKILPQWGRFIFNIMPNGSHGSREKVAAWRKRRQGRTKYLSVSVSHHDHNCIEVNFIEPPESQALEG